jgi:hypothetical protein
MRRAKIGRWGRRLGVTALSLAAGVAAVEGIAAVRVRHLRAERAPLDGRLYTEIRGQGEWPKPRASTKISRWPRARESKASPQ